MEKKSFKNKRSMKENDWSYKERFEILDEKYAKIKDIVKQVLKDLKEEKEKRHLIIKENEKLAAELKERDDLLEQMQSVSEAVIDEYSALKVKCDLETEAANNASKRATKYFQENQKLKHNSHEEPPVAQASDLNELQCQEVGTEETVSELDVLNKLSSELRTEVASLKTQLTKEIEKQISLKEDFEIAKQLYEQEMKEHNCTKEKLNSIQLHFHQNISAKSNDLEKDVKRSSLPHSKRSVNGIEVSVDRRVSDPTENLDIVRKLSLAEKQVASYKNEKHVLLKRVQELESQVKKLHAEVSASESLPIPPPPPPPPPSFNPIKSLITFIHAGKKSAKVSKKENIDLENPQQKAMSEMIDAIKHGKVFLKPTPKNAPECSEKHKAAEESAFGEMKSILSTLKKRNGAKDVQVAAAEGNNSEMEQNIEMSVAEYSISTTDENFNVDSNIDDELHVLFRKKSLKSVTSYEDSIVEDIPHSAGSDNQENQLNSCDIMPCDTVINTETKNANNASSEIIASSEEYPELDKKCEQFEIN